MRQPIKPIKRREGGKGSCCKPEYAHVRGSRACRSPLGCFPPRLHALNTVDPLLGLEAARQKQYRRLEVLKPPALGRGHGNGESHRRHHRYKRAFYNRPLRTIGLPSILFIRYDSSSRDSLHIHVPKGEKNTRKNNHHAVVSCSSHASIHTVRTFVRTYVLLALPAAFDA